MKVLRFIGAVALAVITSWAIRSSALLLFSVTAGMVGHFSFLGLIIFIAVLSIGGSILRFLEPLMLRGFFYTVRGSKFITIAVIIIFINYYVGDWLYYHHDMGWGEYSQHLLSIIKESSGSPILYKIGAGIILLLEFCSYGSIALFLFRKPAE